MAKAGKVLSGPFVSLNTEPELVDGNTWQIEKNQKKIRGKQSFRRRDSISSFGVFAQCMQSDLEFPHASALAHHRVRFTPNEGQSVVRLSDLVVLLKRSF